MENHLNLLISKIKLQSTTANHRNVFQNWIPKLRKRIAILKTKTQTFFNCARAYWCKFKPFMCFRTNTLKNRNIPTHAAHIFQKRIAISKTKTETFFKCPRSISIDANVSYLCAFAIQPNTLKSRDIQSCA